MWQKARLVSLSTHASKEALMHKRALMLGLHVAKEKAG